MSSPGDNDGWGNSDPPTPPHNPPAPVIPIDRARLATIDVVASALKIADGRGEGAAETALAGDDHMLKQLGQVVRRAEKRAERGGGDKRPPGRPAGTDVADLVAFAQKPRMLWGLPELEKVATVPAGSVVVIVGPPGSGKSSLALQVAQHQVSRGGFALFLSIELARLVVTARIVAQNSNRTWSEVLFGGVDRQTIERAVAAYDDLAILDEVGPNWPEVADAWLGHVRRTRGPTASIALVVDYLQILPCAAPNPREHIAVATEALAKVVKRWDAFGIAVSQPSRANAKVLRSGELLGIETQESGAEGAAIERWSVVQLALGGHGDPDEHGWSKLDGSLGKSRFGRGDRVVPLEYHGASGCFRDSGASRAASEVRAERVKDAKVKKEAQKKGDLETEILLILRDRPHGLAIQTLAKLCDCRMSSLSKVLGAMVHGGRLRQIIGVELDASDSPYLLT